MMCLSVLGDQVDSESECVIDLEHNVAVAGVIVLENEISNTST